jgi:hypothetical protein
MKVKRIDLRPRCWRGKFLLVGLTVALMASMPQWLLAKSGSDTTMLKRYLVELRDPPLARYDGRGWTFIRPPRAITSNSCRAGKRR